MTNRCNFNCSYCIQNKDTIKETEEEEYKRLLSQAFHINRLCKKDETEKYFNLYLIGGEISLIKLDYFLNILDKLKDSKFHHIYITSNFSAPSKWFEEVDKKCNELNIKVRFNFSYHEEFFNYERFKEKFYNLNVLKKRVEYCITHKNYDFAKTINNDFDNIQWDYDRNEKWTDEEKIYSSSNNKQLFESVVDTYGSECSNSIYQSYIFPNNFVYGVTCGSRKANGFLNMMSSWIKKPIICNQSSCHACGRLLIKKDEKIIFNNLKEGEL